MSTHRSKDIRNTQKGSFLLELLIAFAIISIAMVVVVDSFITSQRSYETTVESVELTKALTVLFEDITREARVSENFRCTDTLTSPCSSTSYYTMDHIEGVNNQGASETIVYRTQGGIIQKSTDGGTTYTDILPPSVVVDDFQVEVLGEHNTGEQIQALVTVSAHAKYEPGARVHLQTSLTERVY